MKPWLSRMAVGALLVTAVGYLLTPLWIAVLLCILFYLLLEPAVGSLQAAGVRKDLAIATALLPPLIALIYFAVYLADVADVQGQMRLPRGQVATDHRQQVRIVCFGQRLIRHVARPERARRAEAVIAVDMTAPPRQGQSRQKPRRRPSGIGAKVEDGAVARYPAA